MDVIFDALEKGWKGAERNLNQANFFIVWGLIGNNEEILRKYHLRTFFVDMPYFNRWLPGEDLKKSNWRFCLGDVHNKSSLDVSFDRFESFGVKVSPWQMGGDHILVCPSSNTMTKRMHNMSAESWTEMVVEELKKKTNRPIKVRLKPRKNGTSGPSVADVSIEKDLEGCHALVTSGSLTAIDALLNGVPVFTTAPKTCPAAWCSNTDFDRINKPVLFDREQLLANLAWKQFSIQEMENGFCYENVMRLQYN